jgi:hypothetical protein
MGIENNSASGAGYAKLSKHSRWSALELEKTGRDASLPKHLYQPLSVPPNIDAIGSKIGNREQIGEFAQDARFMRRPVTLSRIAKRCRANWDLRI